MWLVRMLREKPLKFGIIYTCVLWYLAFMACAFGHGTYVPLAVSSAPAGFIMSDPPDASLVVFLLPILWMAIFCLLSQVHLKFFRWIFIVIMAIHYVSAAFLSQSKHWNDWDYFTPKELGQLFVWLFVYLGGQYLLWSEFSRRIGAKPVSMSVEKASEDE